MNIVLIFLITIFSISLFFYGKSKTKTISIKDNIKLNALPKFYGYYLVLWCSIPALVFLLVWSLFEPVIINSIIIETAANQGAILSDKNEANLIYEKIKAIHLGTYFGDIDSILRESAIAYAKFINLFTNSKVVLIFGIIIASVIYSLKKIKNEASFGIELQVTIGFIFLVYGICEYFLPESGLPASVAAGFIVGKREVIDKERLDNLIGELAQLAITVLFPLLAADVSWSVLSPLGWGGVVCVFMLMVIVRPISIWIATMGRDLNLKEKIFLAWLAPRGIVTAAVASLFSIRLEQAGILGAGRLQGLVFLTILMTVGIQGLSAKPLVNRLKLDQKNNFD